MSGVSEESLRKAKSSQSTVLARDWNRDKIEKYIEFKQIFSVEMLADSCLYVFFNPVPVGAKFNNIPIYDHFIVEPNAPSYEDFLDLSGISKPGQIKDFI